MSCSQSTGAVAFLFVSHGSFAAQSISCFSFNFCFSVTLNFLVRISLSLFFFLEFLAMLVIIREFIFPLQAVVYPLCFSDVDNVDALDVCLQSTDNY